MGRRWAGLWLLTACLSTVVVDFPVVTPAPLSAVVVVEASDRVDLRALELGGAPLPIFSARPTDTLTILYYGRPLSELQLVPGILPLVSEDEPGARPLPPTQQILASDPDFDSVRSFKEVELSDRLARLRIAGVVPQQCLQNGGCLDQVEGQPSCDRACQPNLPLPPASPEVPRLYQQCPIGYSARMLRDGELLVCDPPPRLASCAPGEWQGAGDAECVADGPACPVGRFSTSLPTRRRLIYVDPDAAPGGDGSAAAPFLGLGEALNVALPDGVVALSKGEHTAALQLPETARVDLIGACTAQTIIGLPAGDQGLAWRGQGELRDLTIRGAVRALRVTGSPASATLRRVLVEGGSEGGVLVEGGARLIAERLRIRDLRPEAPTELELVAVTTSTLTARGLILEMGTDGYRLRAPEARKGLEVIQGTVDLREVVIVGGLQGIAADQSRVVLEGALLQEAKKSGFRAAGGQFLLRDLTMRDLGVPGLAGDATGLELRDGAAGRVERASFRAVFNRSVRVEGANVTLTDLVVEQAPVLQIAPNAIPCRTRFQRLHAEQPGKYGFYLTQGCEVEADDVWMRGFPSGTENGDGVYLNGSTLVGRRWSLEDGTGGGFVAWPDATLELEDLQLRGFKVGIGLFATGSSLTLRRARISESRAVGVCLAPDGLARIEDLLVERTGLPITEDGACPAEQSAGGAALLVSANLDAQVLRFELRDNRDTGLLVFDGPFVGVDGSIHGNGIGVRSTTRLRLAEQLVRVRVYDNRGDLALED
jgi:hypothetical protein